MAHLELDTVSLREVRLTGAVGYTPAAWQRVVRLLWRGVPRVADLARPVTASYPLGAWREAFAAAASRREGKVLLRPQGEAAVGTRL
jgi:threonine dehydrogenase-like Zn-dependent dehydrogenase